MTKEPKKDKCFPFESIEDTQTVSKIELKEEIEGNDYTQSNTLFNMKFKTKRYYINEKGKKRRVKRERKYKTDDIRKKIKVQFHKVLKNLVNNNLKKVGSSKFFTFLPQLFIGNINKEFNTKYLEYTYKELLLTDFSLCRKNYKNKAIDYKNYLYNKDTIEYLEQNEAIEKYSGFDLLKNIKYKDLLKAYFSSKEFENSILELKGKNENVNYIQRYIKLAKTYLKYFCSSDKETDKREDKKEIKDVLIEELGNYFSLENFDDFNLDVHKNYFNKNNQ